MREDIETPSQKTPAEPAIQVEHAQWQVTRLIVAVFVCLFIIGAAIAYEKFG